MEDLSSLEEYLYQLEQKLIQPEVRRSRKELELLIADDFIEFGGSGKVYDKKIVVEELPNEPIVPMALENFQAVLLAPGIALATYRVVKYDKLVEKNIYSLRNSIWRIEESRWKLFFHQGTPIE